MSIITDVSTNILAVFSQLRLGLRKLCFFTAKMAVGSGEAVFEGVHRAVGRLGVLAKAAASEAEEDRDHRGKDNVHHSALWISSC